MCVERDAVGEGRVDALSDTATDSGKPPVDTGIPPDTRPSDTMPADTSPADTGPTGLGCKLSDAKACGLGTGDGCLRMGSWTRSTRAPTSRASRPRGRDELREDGAGSRWSRMLCRRLCAVGSSDFGTPLTCKDFSILRHREMLELDCSRSRRTAVGRSRLIAAMRDAGVARSGAYRPRSPCGSAAPLVGAVEALVTRTPTTGHRGARSSSDSGSGIYRAGTGTVSLGRAPSPRARRAVGGRAAVGRAARPRSPRCARRATRGVAVRGAVPSPPRAQRRSWARVRCPRSEVFFTSA